MVLTSYEIAFLLAKCGKPYSDGEIIKKSFDIFTKNANDSKMSTYVNDISLSRNTIMRRIDEISSDISKQISFSTTNSKYFSLALDVSCDITDNPQLSIFIRSVNSKFEVTEKLLGLEELKTSTKGTDIFNKLKCCVETLLLKSDDLIWSKLESVCIDGAPCMIGKNIGCVTLLEEFLNRNLNKYHCIIHLEALCANIIIIVIKIILTMYFFLFSREALPPFPPRENHLCRRHRHPPSPPQSLAATADVGRVYKYDEYYRSTPSAVH